jgi:hypothetical protein
MRANDNSHTPQLPTFSVDKLLGNSPKSLIEQDFARCRHTDQEGRCGQEKQQVEKKAGGDLLGQL